MPKFHFALKGWNLRYSAEADDEAKARKAINPYLPLYKDAKAKWKKYLALGVLSEAEFYQRQMKHHADNATAFHLAARIIPSARKAEPIPVAKPAPPIMATLAPLAPKQAKVIRSPSKKRKR